MREVGCYSDIDNDYLCPNVMREDVDSCPTPEEIIDHLWCHCGRISTYPLSCDTMISCHNDDRFLFYVRQGLFAHTSPIWQMETPPTLQSLPVSYTLSLYEKK